MLEPAGGGGFDFVVSTHMLNSAAGYLHGEAEGIASCRNGFNSACFTAEGAFGNANAAKSFNQFFQAWFTMLDAQAETLESTADATQQCAVQFDHTERKIYGAIAAMPTKPPPAPPTQQPSNPFSLLNPSRNVA
jgi:uncharacterized protein YukE